MNDELTKAANALKEALVYAACEYSGFVSELIEHFAPFMNTLVEDVGEYYAIQEHATPNERRMMHHRKKRIRRKYYNRVKRRIVR